MLTGCYNTLMGHFDMSVFSARIGAVFLSCALVFSFGLHSVDTQHLHPGEHPHTHHDTQKEGDAATLSEYVHMGEKKLFVGVMSIFFVVSWATAIGAVVINLCSSLTLEARVRLSQYRKDRLVLWQQQLYAQGILHPKLF